MSADRWSRCPRCFKKATADAEQARVLAEQSYGQVPVEQFEAARQGAAELEEAADNLEESLREDFTIRVTANEGFEVDYSAVCDTTGCGFRMDFQGSKVRNET